MTRVTIREFYRLLQNGVIEYSTYLIEKYNHPVCVVQVSAPGEIPVTTLDAVGPKADEGVGKVSVETQPPMNMVDRCIQHVIATGPKLDISPVPAAGGEPEPKLPDLAVVDIDLDSKSVTVVPKPPVDFAKWSMQKKRSWIDRNWSDITRDEHLTRDEVDEAVFERLRGMGV